MEQVPSNYRVEFAAFGAYPTGSVLPEWAVRRAGSPDELVARGVLSRTESPVNVELRTPPPRTAADPDPAVVDEANRLRKENADLADSNRALVARLGQAQTDLAARDRALGEQTAQIAHWQTRHAALEAENAQLKADLEALTAPKAESAKDRKAKAAGAAA